MYVIGFCDSLLDMLDEYVPGFDGIVTSGDDRSNDVRLIGCICVVLILGLAVVGMDWVTRVSQSKAFSSRGGTHPPQFF